MKASKPVYINTSEGSKQHRIKVQFIPARVFDNEDLLRNNPNYLSNLLKMSEEDRRIFIHGDFNDFYKNIS